MMRSMLLLFIFAFSNLLPLSLFFISYSSLLLSLPTVRVVVGVLIDASDNYDDDNNLPINLNQDRNVDDDDDDDDDDYCTTSADCAFNGECSKKKSRNTTNDKKTILPFLSLSMKMKMKMKMKRKLASTINNNNDNHHHHYYDNIVIVDDGTDNDDNYDPESPGKCECFSGWKGRTCEVLDLLPVDPKRIGLDFSTTTITTTIDQTNNYTSLPLPSSSSSSTTPNTTSSSSSWGGSILYDEIDDIYHMFASEILYGCGLYSWTTNSQVRNMDVRL